MINRFYDVSLSRCTRGQWDEMNLVLANDLCDLFQIVLLCVDNNIVSLANRAYWIWLIIFVWSLCWAFVCVGCMTYNLCTPYIVPSEIPFLHALGFFISTRRILLHRYHEAARSRGSRDFHRIPYARRSHNAVLGTATIETIEISPSPCGYVTLAARIQSRYHACYYCDGRLNIVIEKNDGLGEPVGKTSP